MKKPKTIWDINNTIILSNREPVFSSYDNKPLNKWNYDDFAGYILDNQHSDRIIGDNYFSICLKDYFEVIPLLQGNYERVFLYGVYDIINAVLKEKIK